MEVNKEEKILETLIDIGKEMRERTNKYPRKFIGALTIELLRKGLIKEGFNVSNRDVFIIGMHNELDLIILKKKQKARENLLYYPDQVVAVFEIKFNGTYTKNDISNIKKVFRSIKRLNKKILCLYLTISENSNFVYYPEEKKLGDYSFFLFLREISPLEDAIEKGKLYKTGDWNKLIGILKKVKDAP